MTLYPRPISREMRQNLFRSVEDIPPPLANLSSDIFISDVKSIASYNWLYRKKPIILVPGHPNIWLGPDLPLTLQTDAGKIFIDQNAYHLPQFPLLPLFAATKFCSPDYSLPLTDFITDLRVLVTLWQWASRDKPSTPLSPRRIDIELVQGKTVLMQHWVATGNAVKVVKDGFANEFAAACTSPASGLETAYGHYRIISYTFGGFQMLVRYRVDACLDDPGPPRQPSPTSPHAEPPSSVFPAVSMNLQSVGGNRFQIEQGGNFVQQSSLVKLEVVQAGRLRESGDDWFRIYPESLLSQTSNIYLCVHTSKGVFSRVNRMNLGAVQMRYSMSEGRGSLAKLHAVLTRIREILIAGDDPKLTLIISDHSPSIIVHRRVDDGGLIPRDSMTLFKT